MLIVAERASWVAANLQHRIARLEQEGFVVHVAAGADGGFEALPESCIPRPLPIGASSWPGAFVLIQSYIIENEPLLVHGFGTPWAWFAAVAASRVGSPGVVATIERQLLGDGAEYPKLVGWARSVGLPVDELGSSLHRFLAERVDRYVTTTEQDLELAQEFVPGNKLELALGGFGVDVADLNPYASHLPSKEEVRQTFGVTGRRVVGVSSGRLATADEFVADLDRAAPGVDVVSQGQSFGGVRGLGTISDRLFFRMLDTFVAWREDEPRWAQGAAASAVAVVAEESRAHRDIVVDGDTGRLVARELMARTTAEMLDDPAFCDQAGVRARTRAVSRFDRRQVDEQLLRIYDAVLRGKMT